MDLVAEDRESALVAHGEQAAEPPAEDGADERAYQGLL